MVEKDYNIIEYLLPVYTLHEPGQAQRIHSQNESYLQFHLGNVRHINYLNNLRTKFHAWLEKYIQLPKERFCKNRYKNTSLIKLTLY